MKPNEIQQIIDETCRDLNAKSWNVYEFETINRDRSIHRYIDHTFLKAVSDSSIISNLCDEANTHSFFSVCVQPTWISFAKQQLSNSEVKICTVIGFPLGANTSESKCAEIEDAISKGADEIDFVVNLAWIKEKKLTLIYDEFQSISKTCKSNTITSKVILETCYLDENEIATLCVIARCAGIDFVKTSTGFGTGGATKAHVRLMRSVVGTEMGVKASGGIRSKDDAEIMIANGANRLGASSGVDIMKGLKSDHLY